MIEPAVVRKRNIYKQYNDDDAQPDPNPNTHTNPTNTHTYTVEILITVALLDPEGCYDVLIDHNTPITSPPIIHFGMECGGSSSSNSNSDNGDDSDMGSNSNSIRYIKGSKYLSALDLLKIQWGVDRVRDIVRSAPMNEIVVAEVSPGPGVVSSAGSSGSSGPGSGSTSSSSSTVDVDNVELVPGGMLQWVSVCMCCCVYVCM